MVGLSVVVEIGSRVLRWHKQYVGIEGRGVISGDAQVSGLAAGKMVAPLDTKDAGRGQD